MARSVNKLSYGNQPVQGGKGAKADDRSGVAIGVDATSESENAVAIGSGALAAGEGSVAVGEATEVDQALAFAFGDRDVLLDPDRAIYAPDDTNVQTVMDVDSTDDASDGDTVGYALAVGGEEILSVRADADGSGGITNPRVVIPDDLTVDGETTATDTEVTGTVDLQDGDDSTQFLLDATASPPEANFYGNDIQRVADAEVESLSGDLVGRDEPIDNLDGNIYVTEAGADDPTENDHDIWIEVDTSGSE